MSSFNFCELSFLWFESELSRSSIKCKTHIDFVASSLQFHLAVGQFVAIDQQLFGRDTQITLQFHIHVFPVFHLLQQILLVQLQFISTFQVVKMEQN